jgi:hypothetical protein
MQQREYQVDSGKDCDWVVNLECFDSEREELLSYVRQSLTACYKSGALQRIGITTMNM